MRFIPYRIPNKYILFDLFSFAEYQHVCASKFRLLNKQVKKLIDDNLDILLKNTKREKINFDFMELLFKLSDEKMKNYLINIHNPRDTDALGLARRVLNFLSNLNNIKKIKFGTVVFKVNEETISVFTNLIKKFRSAQLLVLNETPKILKTVDKELIERKFDKVYIDHPLDGLNPKLLTLTNLKRVTLGLEVIN
jgi:hypothetical protein